MPRKSDRISVVTMYEKVAFVTGCNGVSGNAIVEHLVRCPKEEWYVRFPGFTEQSQLISLARSKIIVTSRRRPPYLWPDPRLEFIAIDFLKPVEETTLRLRRVCKDVTHAFFTSYVHVDDFSELRRKNVPLFKNFLDVITTVAPGLRRVCLQTGTKVRGAQGTRLSHAHCPQYYGCHRGPVQIPVCESLPRYEDNDDNFYLEQEDYLRHKQAGKPWSYNVVRPHAIVGYAPHGQ